MANIELSEMIGQLREELLKARGESEGSDLKFQVEDIEIELQLVTTKAAGAKSGVKFWVINAEANANASQANTQKLKLKLKPRVGPNEEPLKVLSKPTPLPP
ncbi:MAG: trypco2 family protein [Albidovulum sp.]